MKISKIAIIIVLLALGFFNQNASAQALNEETFKVGRTLSLIDAFYVDSVNLGQLAEDMIVSTLKKLDPHSTYVSAKDVKAMNEPLQGNFEGIGIQFNVLHDTLIVVEPIAGGPSEKVGLRAGDRILTISGEKVTNIGTDHCRSILQTERTKRNHREPHHFTQRRKRASRFYDNKG